MPVVQPFGSTKATDITKKNPPMPKEASIHGRISTGEGTPVGVASRPMSNATLGLPEDLHAYLLEVGVREPDILRQLRDETATLPMSQMQIAPEQGALMGLLAELIGARRYLEVGTFTGYSSLSVALRLPTDGTVTCCDISREWTDVARRYWRAAGVEAMVELRLAPALETLAALRDEGRSDWYDFAFVDADKESYPAYHEAVLDLLRPGGLVAYDNVFQDGAVADPAKNASNVRAIRALNAFLATDDRVSLAMVPIADGLTLARKR